MLYSPSPTREKRALGPQKWAWFSPLLNLSMGQWNNTRENSVCFSVLDLHCFIPWNATVYIRTPVCQDHWKGFHLCSFPKGMFTGQSWGWGGAGSKFLWQTCFFTLKSFCGAAGLAPNAHRGEPQELLPWTRESEVTLDRGSESIGTQEIDLRCQSGPRFGLAWSIVLQFPQICILRPTGVQESNRILFVVGVVGLFSVSHPLHMCILGSGTHLNWKAL